MTTIQARKESFSDSILRFVKENQFGAILLLSGADVTNRSDAQMLYVAIDVYCVVLLRPAFVEHLHMPFFHQMQPH